MAGRATLLSLALIGMVGAGWGLSQSNDHAFLLGSAERPDTPQMQALYLVEGQDAGRFGNEDDWRLVGRYTAIVQGGGKLVRKRFATELVDRQAARDPLGLYILASVQGRDIIWPADPAAARATMQLAAETGHVQAQFEIGEAHVLGESGFKADAKLAEMWLRRAADNGHALAAETLASNLAEGRNGFELDCQAAWDYALQTQDAFEAQSDTEGREPWVHTPMLLGLIRDDDCQSLPALPEQALAWLEDAARIEGAVYGNGGAILVARLYETDPRFKNPDKAAYWYDYAKTYPPPG